MRITHGLLAAVASVALIAGAGGVYAQGAGGGAGGDTQMQGQKPQGGAPMPGGAQTQGGAKTGDKMEPGSAQTQSPGSGKTQTGQSGMDAKPGQAQTPGSGKTQTGQSGMDKDSKPGQAQTGKDATGDKPAQLSEQQRTKISSTIREQKNLKRVERTNINFNINVGTVVPRTVGLVPLPAPIIAVVPAYRGFLYIVVGDDLLIVHPRTYEIVAVIPA